MNSSKAPLTRDDRLAFSIPEAARKSASSRSALYEAIKRGDLVARKNGRRTVILTDDLQRWVQGLKPIHISE